MMAMALQRIISKPTVLEPMGLISAFFNRGLGASSRATGHVVGRLPNINASLVAGFSRQSSSSTGTVTDLRIDEEKGYATLALSNDPANALSTPCINELSHAIREVEKSKCRGLLLTSGVKNIFSAGLNFEEFGGPGSTVESVCAYYESFQDLWFQLFKSPLATIAAMNGHAIAGGCGLAMACDYRILATPNFRIGMNEVLFGVPVPYYLLDIMVQIMGWHNAAKAAQTAKILSADEAVTVGLVDEICTVDDIQVAAARQMKQYLKCNERARRATKADAKQPIIDRFLAVKQSDLDRVTKSVNDPETKAIMFAYIESLKKPKK